MANRRRGRGRVDGVSFKNYREAIYLIVSKYLGKNPNMTYYDFVYSTKEIQDFSINDNNDRSFIKTEIAYYRLPQNLQRKFYDSRPLNIEGKNYYLKTETDEKHALKVIEFGEKNGISITLDNAIFNNNSFCKIINSELFPKEVDKEQFIDFIEKLPGIGHNHSFSLHRSTIIIELSNLEPTKTYGILTLDDVKNIFIKMIKEKNYEYADDLIERINNAKSKDDLLELASPIAEIIMDRDIDDGYEKALEMIQDLIGQIKFTGLILGCFYYEPYWNYDISKTKNEKIILYVKNIEACQKNYGGVFNAFKAVIAHELFHYFHCSLSKFFDGDYTYEFSHRSDYLSDVLKESLASYYEWVICKLYQIPNDLILSWNTHSIKIYPYSGAKYISDIHECGKILGDSIKHGMNRALYDLVKDKKMYYEIINIQKNVKKRAIIKNNPFKSSSASLKSNFNNHMPLWQPIIQFIGIDNKLKCNNPTFYLNNNFLSYFYDLLNKRDLSLKEFSTKFNFDLIRILNGNKIDLITIFKICIELELDEFEGKNLLKKVNHEYDKNNFLDELLNICLCSGLYDKDVINENLSDYGIQLFGDKK